ncbi:MAG TPA: aminotransferase class V-fold PLP-dependent enzyme [Pyrinomonadaceae bacterium]|jgi:selenocysteine lyase/cysteine desulfurase|nr:aminotransferase class V-fold PLP-dependent enzyme [Pyrinomonadaceae bacterium]
MRFKSCIFTFKMINWNDIRSRFPITEKTAYLNTAAAGPLARSTMSAAMAYYRQMTEDADQHWDEWLARREEVRRNVARFINAEPDEIALTTNTSSGMNIIVDALENRGEVISCELEFPVSTITWMHRQIPVHLVKAIGGAVPVEELRKAMTSKTGIVSLSHVQFSNGFRFDLNELGEIKGDHALVINASQSAGAFEIDVKASRIDALCATGHKWMLSGYGSGFVYLSRELQERVRPRAIGWLSVDDPYAMLNAEIHLRHDAAARTELGCPHFAGMFALGASVEMMMEIGIQNIERRVLELNKYLTNGLSESGWRVLSPLTTEKFRSAETLVEAGNPAEIVPALAARGIAVTEKPQGIRVATDFFNNEPDVDRLIEGLEVLKK